jgi:hypothetical protein
MAETRVIGYLSGSGFGMILEILPRLDIPRPEASSCRAEFVWFAVPGEVLVVEGVGW